MKPMLFTLLLTLAGWTNQLATAQENAANVCFILYQMADNNLEAFIRDDNYELIQSPAIREKSLTTWVYFDGRNYGNNPFENIREPLQEIYNRDGTPITVANKGSRYMTWDHDQDLMVVDQTLATEQNGDNPQTVIDFVTHALTDCVARGTTEYFIAFSSHGSGWGGFGGDDNQSRRALSQANQDLAGALQQSLAAVAGAPAIFDVLGFDACLMSAVGALDEFYPTTKYLLASEATEPGHGWAYKDLDNVNSALEMAKDIHTDFLEQMQGNSHQLPKTLAIVDTELFLTFLAAWETFSAELSKRIDAQDEFLLPNLSRARQIAISFEAYSDDKEQTSALDIGSFLATFESLCQPEDGSDLKAARDATVTAYYAMQVASGVGPGTQEATGVHIMWPTRRFYDLYRPWYDENLFNDSQFATQSAPKWLTFLQNYYNASPSLFSSSKSVCVGNPTSLTAPTREGQLLLTPSAKQDGIAILTQSEVTRSTDEVFVEFGLDLTPGIGIGRRDLYEVAPKENAGLESQIVREKLNSRFGRVHQRRRRLADEDDYLILFGGTVTGSYDESNFAAAWDGNFFIIGDSANNSEPVYASQNGGGSKDIPVFYYPNDISVSSADFPRGTTVDEAIALGGVFGYLTIAYDGTTGLITDSATLYTETRETFSETPRSAGGKIVPILFTEGSINGADAPIYVGGFFGTVVDWTEENSITFTVQGWKTTLEERAQLGLETVVVTMLAIDNEKFDADSSAGIDLKTFQFPEKADSASSSVRCMSALLATVVSLFVLHPF